VGERAEAALVALRDAPIGGQAVLEGVMMRGVSTWISGWVERVVNSLPHVQRTWDTTYSGWMPVFMVHPV
jgi:uncharacterized protein YqhQ